MSVAAKPSVNDFIRRKIREIRLSRQMAMTEVAANLGIPVSSYAALEYGECRINVESLFRILGALRAQITDIWPMEASVRVTARDEFHMRCIQEFRLNELVSLFEAEGATLLRVRCQAVTVLLQDGLTEEALQRIPFYVRMGRIEWKGFVFTQCRNSTVFHLFVKGGRTSPVARQLARIYLKDWAVLFC